MKLTLLLVIPISLFAKDPTGLSRYKKIVEHSIEKSSGTQKKILQNALKMVESRVIIRGSCWDYIDRVYRESNASKVDIFSSKKSELYADIDKIKPADWLYHINYSYKNIEHSGLFIDWVDKNKTEAVMLSYAGEKKLLPARFRVYNIKSTYNIVRAKEKEMDYISIKDYARVNKISIFNAIKLAKSGKVETITKDLNGKEHIFIKNDSTVLVDKEPNREPTVRELMKEIEKLKSRVDELERKVSKGNK